MLKEQNSCEQLFTVTHSGKSVLLDSGRPVTLCALHANANWQLTGKENKYVALFLLSPKLGSEATSLLTGRLKVSIQCVSVDMTYKRSHT